MRALACMLLLAILPIGEIASAADALCGCHGDVQKTSETYYVDCKGGQEMCIHVVKEMVYHRPFICQLLPVEQCPADEVLGETFACSGNCWGRGRPSR